MNETINFTLNGKSVSVSTDSSRSLLWVLRTEFELTGTKYGCGEGLCGSCTVLVNERAVRSCQTLIKSVQSKSVITIEGLSNNGSLHPLQKAFIEHNAVQCGFCTPGMILNAYSLLMENPTATEQEITEGMDDNLCRCGSYKRIVQAIFTATEEMRKGGAR